MHVISGLDASLLAIAGQFRKFLQKDPKRAKELVQRIEDKQTRIIAQVLCELPTDGPVTKGVREGVAGMHRWLKSLAEVHAPPSRRKRYVV